MKKKLLDTKFTIKEVVATGIGAALFVVIGMISIPTPVPNTSIQLQYAVQALFSVIFGPFVGFLMGLIGHVIKDAMAGYGLWWSWIIASAFFGFILGLFKNRIRAAEGVFEVKDIVNFNIFQLLANAFVWLLIEPVNKVFVQGFVVTLSNGVTVAVSGTLLLLAYARTQTHSGSLKKD